VLKFIEKGKMRRFIAVLFVSLFMGSLLLSCKAMHTSKKGEDAEITTPPNVSSNKLSKKRQ
jgi:preprotein translocase subunit SecG